MVIRSSFAVLVLLVCGCAALGASDAIFETRQVRLAISTNGAVASLLEKKTNREWLATGIQKFAAIKKGGKFFQATGLTPDAKLWHAEFGDSGVQVDFRITTKSHYIVFEVVKINGSGVEELRLGQIQVLCKEKNGWPLGVTWNDQFAVCWLGLSDCIDSRPGGNGLALASVYPEFGMDGQRAVLVATPAAQFLDVVREVEHDFDLPSPTLGGKWAKTSRDVRTGYFFSDLTENNADETIRYAKLGGFGYVMTYDGTWAKSLGSYPINSNNFPRGEESLKATVDKCHRAGLKVGLHCLTSFIHKYDPLVRPVPDPRLLKDDEAILAADLDEKTNQISAVASLASFPTEGAFYGDRKSGFDIQIDDELIQYRAVGGLTTNRLMKCIRGYTGTKTAPHKAGAKIHHIVERYGCYLADLRTTLKDQIADRIAGVINRCGFDMIYFDGGECNAANGPYWYWVSQQQDATCKKFKREVLVQGSGDTHWTWHWFARGCCDDFAAVAPKQYLDCHKIADSWESYTHTFTPPELGWWGFLAAEPHQPATSPDEVEFYATRMIALDTPVSLETHLGALKRNGRTEEMLKLLGDFELLRLSHAVPANVRKQLKTGEWHLVCNGKKKSFVPIRYYVQRTTMPGEIFVTNSFAAQPLQFRLQSVPILAPVGATNNIVLLRADPPADLKPPDAKAAMPGAMAGRLEFAKAVGDQSSIFMVGQNAKIAGGQEGKPLNLLHHRALAVKIHCDGVPTNEKCAVLNVQLEAGGKTYRDHYVDLNFAGERTIIIPEPNTERMLPEFRPANANYAFKAAMYGFNYGNIVALNLRWMRSSKSPALVCRVESVEALAEIDEPLADPEIIIAGTTNRIPARLNAGDYIEYWSGGPARIFDQNGNLLTTLNPLGDALNLSAGANRVQLRSEKTSAAKFTLITTGATGDWW